MGKVHVLPAEIISKIAAGEVIERPASVVKELVENSLDAKADSIEIHLKQAGKKLIRIKDTGTGIDTDDIEKIFLRHSTSKISALGDLDKIETLGFRGEALYSIAAISDITLHSKTQSADTGWEINVRGNQNLSSRPTGLSNGTEIEVKELFFNTPARKKFLKPDTTELKQILNTLIPYTILFPTVRFLLTNNTKILLDIAAQENYLQRIQKVLNLNPENLIEIQQEIPGTEITLHFILGNINIQRPSKNLQFIFINDRPVENRNLNIQINQAYRLILPYGVNPFFSVFIKMHPEDIDVNVHPTKRQVKLKNDFQIGLQIRNICENTLMSYGKAKQINESVFQFKPHSTQYPAKEEFGHAQFVKDNSQVQYTVFSHLPQSIESEKEENLSSNNSLLKDRLRETQYIGTFLKKYLLFETTDSLFIIDQHAAHERITYEKLKQQLDTGKIEIQQLLTPILIRTSPQEMLAWNQINPKIEELGFSTTIWGNETIAIHSHPQLINNPETALRNLLGEENQTGYDLDALIRRACRQSVMWKDSLKKEETEFLRSQLLKCADPFICPHGRPTVIEIKESFLNRQFLRG